MKKKSQIENRKFKMVNTKYFLSKKAQISFGIKEEAFIFFVDKNIDEYEKILSPIINKEWFRMRIFSRPCPTLWELYKIQKYIIKKKINHIRYGNMCRTLTKLFNLCIEDSNNFKKISLYISDKNGSKDNYDYVLIFGKNIRFYIKKNEKELKIEENFIIQLTENYDNEFYTFSIFPLLKYIYV